MGNSENISSLKIDRNSVCQSEANDTEDWISYLFDALNFLNKITSSLV